MNEFCGSSLWLLWPASFGFVMYNVLYTELDLRDALLLEDSTSDTATARLTAILFHSTLIIIGVSQANIGVFPHASHHALCVSQAKSSPSIDTPNNPYPECVPQRTQVLISRKQIVRPLHVFCVARPVEVGCD